MFLKLTRRLKPFVLLVTLFYFLRLLYTLNLFFENYEDKVFVNLNGDPRDDVNQQICLLRAGFKKTLDQYKTSRSNFGKKFTDAVLKNASYNNFQLVGKISKQSIVCNDKLFLLIQVHSSPENFMSRQAIRLSWGSMDHYIGNRQENNATMR